jgi:hypothetical protein
VGHFQTALSGLFNLAPTPARFVGRHGFVEPCRIILQETVEAGKQIRAIGHDAHPPNRGRRGRSRTLPITETSIAPKSFIDRAPPGTETVIAAKLFTFTANFFVVECIDTLPADDDPDDS